LIAAATRKAPERVRSAGFARNALTTTSISWERIDQRVAWARQPPGAIGHRALARLVEQRGMLTAIAIDPACADGIHPERLRQLAHEGARFTAHYLRALSPLRRARLLARVRFAVVTTGFTPDHKPEVGSSGAPEDHRRASIRLHPRR
jgi:hypothetical protein